MKIGAKAMKNGTIIIRTNNPEFESSGQARLKVDNYDTYEAAIAQGEALVDDVLAYRLALQNKSNDGYTKTLF
jgi:glutamate synthase domain-containing protein 3